MTEHQYEARCACGAEWRIFIEHPDGEIDEDPMATCLACGADTFDLTDLGEVCSAGPGTT